MEIEGTINMSTPIIPTSAVSEPYEIKTVTENDIELILNHVRTFFFKDEPVNVSVKLIEFEDSTCIELENFCISTIHEGTSLMAVTSSGKIIGVCLNNFFIRNSPNGEGEECANPKFAKIIKLLLTVDKQGDVFGQFPDVDKIMNVKVLSVDGAWRGKGIATKMMDKTRNIAREQGCGLMRVDCSSYFSARAIARLGFDCIYSLNYEDYKEDGHPVFTPEDPHKALTIYVQRIIPL